MKPFAIAVLAVALMVVVSGCNTPSAAGPTIVKRYSQLWPAEATSTAWLARNSAAAIEGVVLGVGDPTKSKDAAGREIVMHKVSIRVDRTLKGSHRPGQTVVVLVPGGTVDGLSVENPDAPSFAKGEHVLVALTTTATTSAVTGGLHGKFTVTGATAQRDARIPDSARSLPLSTVEEALSSN